MPLLGSNGCTVTFATFSLITCLSFTAVSGGREGVKEKEEGSRDRGMGGGKEGGGREGWGRRGEVGREVGREAGREVGREAGREAGGEEGGRGKEVNC